MEKRLKFFLDGVFGAEVSRYDLYKKKGEIITSIRTKQVEEYKKINARQIEKRKELARQYL